MIDVGWLRKADCWENHLCPSLFTNTPPFLLTQAFALSQLPAELLFQPNSVKASEPKVLYGVTQSYRYFSFYRICPII